MKEKTYTHIKSPTTAGQDSQPVYPINAKITTNIPITNGTISSDKIEPILRVDYYQTVRNKDLSLFRATLSLSKNTGWATESNIEIVYCVAKGLDEAKDMIMKRFSELPKVKGYFIKFVSIEILAQETPDSLSNLLVMYP